MRMWIPGATAVAATVVSVWLYFDNRALRAELDDRPALEAAAPAPAPQVAARVRDPWLDAKRTAPTPQGTTPPPALPEPPQESRLERRVRNQQDFAARFGRWDGESEDDYRARVMPLIKAGLAIPRSRVEDMRKQAEDKAHVTPQQSQQLDRAFDKVYSDVLDFTNKAVADGQLSPYERNVSGWLAYAGGLGTILDDANGQIGKILSPEQARTMFDSGFEWGEYLGLEAPWENLKAPPPPPK
jgi:hypothetical protein